MPTPAPTLTLGQEMHIDCNVREQIAAKIMALHEAGEFNAGYVISHGGLQMAAHLVIAATIETVCKEILS